MAKWTVLFYRNADESCPLDEFIASRKPREQAKLISWIGQLEKDGPNLVRPFADLLEDGIHELRVKLTGQQIRALYFFCYGEFIVLTHTFAKTTSRVPKREIKRAKDVRSEFLRRYSDPENLRGES